MRYSVRYGLRHGGTTTSSQPLLLLLVSVWYTRDTHPPVQLVVTTYVRRAGVHNSVYHGSCHTPIAAAGLLLAARALCRVSACTELYLDGSVADRVMLVTCSIYTITTANNQQRDFLSRVCLHHRDHSLNTAYMVQVHGNNSNLGLAKAKPYAQINTPVHLQRTSHMLVACCPYYVCSSRALEKYVLSRVLWFRYY